MEILTTILFFAGSFLVFCMCLLILIVLVGLLKWGYEIFFKDDFYP